MITLSTEVGTVDLKEMWDGYREGVSQQGPWIEKSYVVEDYSKRQAVINALRGTISLSGGSTLSVPPHACPESPNIYCVDAYSEPQGEICGYDGGRPVFAQAVIRARYGVIPYNPVATIDPNGNNSFPNDDSPGQPFTYALCRMRIGSEVIRVPGSLYQFDTAPNLPWGDTIGGAVTIGVADLVFTRRFVPTLPMTLILGLINKVNDSPLFGQPMGTIQFRGADTEEDWSSDGKKTTNLVLMFKWREYDHNRHLRPDPPRIFDLVKDTSGNTPYEYANLKPLLTAVS